MGKITLIRADFRLIHGQVVTKWVKEANADTIVVINDALAKDSFLANIYIMAAPQGVKVIMKSIDDAAQSWQEDQFGPGNILVLFKSIDDVVRARSKGFPITELQIGGLGGGPGRVNVQNQISFDESDAKQLAMLQNEGVHVYLHVLPTEPRMELDKALEKFHEKG